MKRLALVLLLAVVCFAQQTSSIVTFPDVAMTGSAVALTATSAYVHWCQFTTRGSTAGTAAGANVYWGDSSVSATRGSLIAPGAGQSIPNSGPVYDTSKIYFYGASGDWVKSTCQSY